MATAILAPSSMDFVTRPCADVPIDLDDADMHSEAGDFVDVPLQDDEMDVERRQQDSDSMRNLGLESSTWSSSSGSFYDDLETSPIGVGSTWYWHSPSHVPEDKPNWIRASPSTNIHHTSSNLLSRSDANTKEETGRTKAILPIQGKPQQQQQKQNTSKSTKMTTTSRTSSSS
ncbi:hypothetical protein FRC17_006953, partial [Serendipita sp. 399]